MRRPLGCLTGSGLVALLLSAVVLIAAAIATGNGIFSPGALNAQGGPRSVGGVASHAELEGRCDACHAAPWTAVRMTDLCLACHTDVGVEIATGDGLHGLLETTSGCRDCHTDHRGPTAALTLADPAGFPHERTGFVLTAHRISGSARSLVCADCHFASLATFAQATCLECHHKLDPAAMTPHVATFGPDCLACHDGIDTYGHAFAHRTYPLVGRHLEATCDACHVGSRDLVALRATAELCVDCHRASDIHQERLGPSCGGCHDPSSWTQATLDHDLTLYPLTGAHVVVACAACHVNRQWIGIGTSCVACHRADDVHDGSLGTACVTCHRTSAWGDVTFDHSRTSFPLTGAHVDVACAACHVNRQWIGIGTSCVACHRADDAHNGAFGTNCGACHRTSAWDDATFDHSRTSFPLTGAHADLGCKRCHAGGTFSGTPSTCAACHDRPASHTSPFTRCGSCHGTTAWRPASFTISHTFPLRHGNAGGVCSKCHPSTWGSWSCARCHSPTNMATRHAQVTGYTATGCVACHPRGGGD